MSYEEKDRSGGFHEDNEYTYHEPWQYEDYRRCTPMGAPKRRHSGGWLIALVVVLVLVGAGHGIMRTVRSVAPSESQPNNVSVAASSDTDTQPGATPQETMQPEAPTQAETPTQQTNSEQPKSETHLELSEGHKGAENYQSEADDALSLQAIYEKMIPSVVSISSTLPNGTATGTGIIMSSDGYIITNHHVISGALSISVMTSGDQIYSATLIGSDEASDLAVLKVDADDLTAAEFGDSDSLRVGDLVVAIGDPLGVQLRGTMTDGIISAINRDLTVNDRKMTLIQTNAALNNGNSGGPLINCYGQVIGINTIKMSSYYNGAAVEGLGFAIPISSAKPIIDELIANGYVAGRPAIGITGETLPTAFRAYYRLPNGIYLTYVNPKSDAAAKGIQEGDIITAINDTQVTSVDEMNTVKNDFSAGDTVTLTIYRGGQYYAVDVILMDQALQ